VAGRLARARAMLARRLAQRGVVLSGGALAALIMQKAASAAVPNSLVVSTILFAAGKMGVSAKVAALTEGVMKAMLFPKLKTAIAIVLIFGFVATGATIITCRTEARQADKPPIAEKPVKQEKEKEGFTAWGKEAGGMQAGLGFRPGEHRAYTTGETVTLVVRVRNVGKKEVKFEYLCQFFIETPPTVTDGKGKPVPLDPVTAFGFHVPVKVNFAPGKEIELYELKLKFEPASEKGEEKYEAGIEYVLNGTGKFHIQYERVFGNSSSGTITLDPTLSKLATGKLELEIKSATEKK
jgi:hypothetical protein